MAKIFIVDDDPVVCRLACYILEMAGYDALALGSGHEAIEALERSTPDVLITDLMMPHMSGFELLQHIRADRRWKKLPVVILTARGSIEDRRKAAEAGSADFLTKPFSSAQLINQVRRLCK